MKALLTKNWTLILAILPYAVAVPTLLSAKACYDNSVQAHALAESQLARAREDGKRLQQRLDSAESRYDADTALFSHWQTRYDSLADRYRITERVLVNTRAARLAGDPTPPRIVYDTVPVPYEVVRTIVATADTAIAACHLLASTCEERVAIRDSLLQVSRNTVAGLRKLKPSGWARLRWTVRDLAIGYALAKVTRF